MRFEAAAHEAATQRAVGVTPRHRRRRRQRLAEGCTREAKAATGQQQPPRSDGIVGAHDGGAPSRPSYAPRGKQTQQNTRPPVDTHTALTARLPAPADPKQHRLARQEPTPPRAAHTHARAAAVVP